MIGRWQTKSASADANLDCIFEYRGGKQWIVERWKLGGQSGINVSGHDPISGELRLWSIGNLFTGLAGRWDELNSQTLGQVQGPGRLIREFPDAKTFDAHWQLLEKGSYVSQKDTSYKAVLVE